MTKRRFIFSLVILHAAFTSIPACYHAHNLPHRTAHRSMPSAPGTTVTEEINKVIRGLGVALKVSDICYLLNPSLYKKTLYAEPVNDPELKKSIAHILDGYGIKQTDVSIMLWDRKTFLQSGSFGFSDAFNAEYFCTGKSIFLDKAALNELNQEEKEFVIAHELSHAIHNHSAKGALLDYRAIPLTYLSYRIVNLPSMPDNVKESPWLCGIFFASYATIFTHIFKFALFPKLEKQADLDAAVALNSAQGGISLFKRAKQAGYDASDPYHPSLTERIAYLEAWERDNKAKQAAHNHLQQA